MRKGRRAGQLSDWTEERGDEQEGGRKGREEREAGNGRRNLAPRSFLKVGVHDLKTSMQEQHKSIIGYFDVNIVRKFGTGSKNYTCVLVLCIRC